MWSTSTPSFVAFLVDLVESRVGMILERVAVDRPGLKVIWHVRAPGANRHNRDGKRTPPQQSSTVHHGLLRVEGGYV
jgi:hypothetical protein